MVRWDRQRQRVYLAGLRLHHGSAGVALAAGALGAAALDGPAWLAAAAVGLFWIADDWHDRPWPLRDADRRRSR